MTENHPADRPGHLDIDTVSAFVDRDLGTDDLAMIEFHLHECLACHREVLEIRTTVILLAGLPQYTPRRSFCLGHEHARMGRRRSRVPRGLSGAGPLASANYPAPAMASITTGESGRAGWLPGLQAAAMVVGVLLLMVTTSDLIGMPPQPADWLSEEPRVQELETMSAPVPAPPQVAQPAIAPASEADSDSETASESFAVNPEPALRVASGESGGTTSGNSASQGVLDDVETAGSAEIVATKAALAAVTSAVPTPGAGLARSPETATEGADAPAPTDAQPSRLRLAQLVLAFALAWLVVSIVGLRWVRGLRRASD